MMSEKDRYVDEELQRLMDRLILLGLTVATLAVVLLALRG